MSQTTSQTPSDRPPEPRIEALHADDREALLAHDQSAFAFDTRGLDAEIDTAMIEWDRAFSAMRGDERAGIYVVFSFGLSVPGARGEPNRELPTAGLSWVAVHPDHRRRGVLRALMAHHLHSVHERGAEPVSILYASEPGIYGRFGYGVATSSHRHTIPARSRLRAPVDARVRTRFVAFEAEAHHELVVSLATRTALKRPGQTVRPASHWQRALADTPDRRPGGAEPLRLVLAERDGEPTGYALLRRTASWGDRAPTGTVRVLDVQALDPESEAALWRRTLDFDLMADVTTPPLPADHPLTMWSADVAKTDAARAYSLWVRIVDVPAALIARGYAGPLDVVLEVTDADLPWNTGRWHLSSADGSAATCVPTTRQADLELNVRELGSAYLGGVTLASLGVAGLVHERTPGTLADCSAAWRTDLLPASPAMF